MNLIAAVERMSFLKQKTIERFLLQFNPYSSENDENRTKSK